MNVFNVFYKSSISIQIITLVLLSFSVLSWGAIIYQIYTLHFTTKKTEHFEDKFWSGIPLIKLYQDSMSHSSILYGMERVFYSGFQKFSQLYHNNSYSLKDTIKETEQIMYIAIKTELKELEMYIVFFNTISAISPYLGLLGTILSIIDVFFELRTSVEYTSLQTIAPGVAEALILTAEGLFVAIPSVIAFYHLNFYIDHIEIKYTIFLKNFLSILQNQIFLKKI